MILRVRVIHKASRNFIKEEEGRLKVYLTQPAENGLANAQLIDLLSTHLKVRKYQIKITHGLKSRNKIVEVA